MAADVAPGAALQTDRIARWLQSPSAYPHAPAAVQRIDTHISSVFLAGPFVYKLKKPLKYDFLDFSTLAAREHACREEVRLNQRLAPGAYVGVVPITVEADGNLALAGKGEVIEWLVQMLRLPTDQTLLRLHHLGQLKPEHIDRLVDLLARFYAGQTSMRMTPADYRLAYLRHVLDNRQALASPTSDLDQAALQRTQGFQLQLLQLRPRLFDERVSAGRIFDGHGDLRPEHICLTDPIAIFDCLEFSDELRRIDAADELAFLATECDFIGAAWVGPQLFRRYRAQSGDDVPPILVDFYQAYRATVRAKVAVLRAAQLAGAASAAAAGEAQAHLELASRYAAPHLRPLLLIVGGLSGTGKSTLAAALSAALGAEHIRTDVVRQTLFPNADPAAPNEGIYPPALRQRVYEELTRRARQVLRSGISVVLDGTFATVASLQDAWRLLADAGGGGLCIECGCRDEIARGRIAARLEAGGDASAATLAVYDQQRQDWQPWPGGVPQLQVNTEQSIADQIDCVLNRLRH